jgi:hypothetical protein
VIGNVYTAIHKEGALRQILFSGFLITALVFGGDGRTPRTSSSDYPVHEDAKTAVIAAVRVPADQLNKNFPADFSKKYIVVEVAIYPNAGAVEIVSADFVLRLADGESHPDTAEEVAGIWRPHTKAHPDVTSNRPQVTTETGVSVANGTDPVTGRRRTSTGTYEGVGVSGGNDPSRPVQYPAGASNGDADRMEALLEKWALPEGKTASPVAGYLYFPVSAKRSKGALELQYAHEDSSANLKLPASK